MFLRRQAPGPGDNDTIDWSEDDNHSDDSASSCSGSDLRSDDTSNDEDDDDSSNLEESSSDEESSYSHTSSLMSNSLSQDEGVFGHVSSIRRRTAGRASPSHRSDASLEFNQLPRDDVRSASGSYSSKRRRFRHRNPVWSLWHCFDVYHERCPRLCGRRSTVLLIVSFVIWLSVRSTYGRDTVGWIDTDDPFEPGLPVKKINELKRLHAERRKAAGRKALGSAAKDVVRDAVDGLSVMVRSTPRRKKALATVEDLPYGCKATEWQTYTFPNCNDIHEIDLHESLHLQKGGPKLPDMGAGDKSEVKISKSEAVTAKKIGYVGSGLWRTVWKVDPRGEALGAVGGDGSFEAPAVLKVMKGEHEVDPRNLDRHRRDALVMERLTSSPNVVSIYGHCGNTVLTEYVGVDLAQVIYRGVEIGGDNNRDKYTRKTPLGRLRLALDVSRGLAAMHDLQGGPILHADIQAKQFLVDSRGVKLNDFNRCRFLPQSVRTGEPCPVKIPSAPGTARSPEEYEGQKLTEKIDVYSTANVFFGILTGGKPYRSSDTSSIKKNVMKGKKPEIHQRYIVPGSSDAAFASLMDRAYELNPKKRISASELVTELERLVEVEEARINK